MKVTEFNKGFFWGAFFGSLAILVALIIFATNLPAPDHLI